MPKLTVFSGLLRKPEWSTTPLKPGEEVTLKTEAPKIKAGQHIEFRILYGTDLVDVVNGADAQPTAKWTVPNLPHSPKLKFDALLHEKPNPKAGIHGVLAKVTSPEAEVKGFRVAITTLDAAFVPHAEKLWVKYNVTDPAAVATKGRIEIWGERYPTDKPLHTENFTPVAGPIQDWKSWDGKATAGPLNGKFISPEFSPYRVRIAVGVDQGSVDDPFAAGLKKVAVVERQFEVEFQSVHIRIQAGTTETAAAGSSHRLNQVLAIEPFNANGTYAAMGRLPLDQEPGPNPPAGPGIGRIRLPMARHDLASAAENPAQGGLLINSPYTAGVNLKRNIDNLYYTRPEIPIEFECRLKSRVPATNNAPTLGLWDKEAVGPVKLEPFAEDPFLAALVGGAGVNQTYWRKCATKVKHGTHQAPLNAGGNPIFHHWEARFVVAADGDQAFDLDTFDANDNTYRYTVGSGELKVYLNRTLLTLGANEPVINKGDADYIEVDVHTIKIRPNFTKANDVIWVVRSAAAGAVANWNAYPPGMNCHAIYGGERGNAPNNLFTKDYTSRAAPVVPREPIIGLTNGTYTYSTLNFIDMAPDPLPAAQQERVEATAVLAGAQQGLAGILFRPSYICGDSYILHARMNRVPYERNLGWEDKKPYLDGKTGQLSIWRVMTVSNSQRLPTAGTNGLAAGVGGAVDPAIGSAGRPHIGDGVNMSISLTNTMLASAFNEWTVPPPNAAIAPAAEIHKDANLANYRVANDAQGLGAAQVTMGANNNTVKNIFSPIDYYRFRLPGNFPANRVRVATAVISGGTVGATVYPGLAAGTTSSAAMAAVSAAVGLLAAGAADAGPAVAIARSANSGQAYKTEVDGVVSAHRDAMINALTPSLAPHPRTMQVIRWPILEDSPIWTSGLGGTNGIHTVGYDRGDGQSIFETAPASLSASLFPHEMGHSMHLVHFSAAAGGFGWKHHHFLQPDCMMSYNFATGILVAPPPPPGVVVGPVGGAAAVDTGWPHAVPAPLPNNLQISNPAAAAGAACIILDAIPPHPAPGNPCSKCVLKLRGWREDILPVAWRHPDLF